jgi:GNAT superfamily N-acetyltransferase
MPRTAAPVTPVTVVPVDALDPADDALFVAWHATDEACGIAEFGDRHTAYSLDEIRAADRDSSERSERFAVVAVAGPSAPGQNVAGSAAAGPRPDVRAVAALYLPLRDNPHLAFSQVAVHPDHRRRGLATMLVTHLESRCRELGRTTMTVEGQRAVSRPDGMTAFAHRLGYQAALVDLRGDLELDRVRPDASFGHSSGSAPAGYRFVTWWDEIPEAWLEHQAVLTSRMSTDAPLGDLALEPENWDAARVREQWQIVREQGRRMVETAAVHLDSGALVGYTSMAVAAHTPDVAYQWDTLVLREHRGHSLGIRLKHANLRALRTELPAVRRVVTWNADSNEPMLRVNRAMGFETVGVQVEWQKHL